MVKRGTWIEKHQKFCKKVLTFQKMYGKMNLPIKIYTKARNMYHENCFELQIEYSVA